MSRKRREPAGQHRLFDGGGAPPDQLPLFADAPLPKIVPTPRQESLYGPTLKDTYTEWCERQRLRRERERQAALADSAAQAKGGGTRV